jgi:hypothetical protein
MEGGDEMKNENEKRQQEQEQEQEQEQQEQGWMTNKVFLGHSLSSEEARANTRRHGGPADQAKAKRG